MKSNLTPQRLTRTLAQRNAEKYERRRQAVELARAKRLPQAIENTARKLRDLLQEAERREVPIDDQLRDLHSTYLRIPGLVDRKWDKTVRDAWSVNTEFNQAEEK